MIKIALCDDIVECSKKIEKDIRRYGKEKNRKVKIDGVVYKRGGGEKKKKVKKGRGKLKKKKDLIQGRGSKQKM